VIVGLSVEEDGSNQRSRVSDRCAPCGALVLAAPLVVARSREHPARR
jgi:hypothetical protein